MSASARRKGSRIEKGYRNFGTRGGPTASTPTLSNSAALGSEISEPTLGTETPRAMEATGMSVTSAAFSAGFQVLKPSERPIAGIPAIAIPRVLLPWATYACLLEGHAVAQGDSQIRDPAAAAVRDSDGAFANPGASHAVLAVVGDDGFEPKLTIYANGELLASLPLTSALCVTLAIDLLAVAQRRQANCDGRSR